MLNLNDLSVFVVAAESNSFSEAGRRLHLSQPAVSQTIEKLEKEFKTRLFVRQGRRVRLSETGQALLPLARELLAGASRLEESMASLQGQLIGEVVLGCAGAPVEYLLPGLIASFRQHYPQVCFHLLASSPESIPNRLQSGAIGLGVTSQRLNHRDLEYDSFFEDDVILIAAAGHPWAGCQEVCPDELLEETMILPPEQSGTRQVLLDGLSSHGLSLDMLKTSLVLGNAEAMVRAVEAAIGVAFISRLAAARSLELGRVGEVRLAGVDLKRKIYLARSRRVPQTRAQVAFWNFIIREQAGKRLPASQGERQFT